MTVSSGARLRKVKAPQYGASNRAHLATVPASALLEKLLKSREPSGSAARDKTRARATEVAAADSLMSPSASTQKPSDVTQAHQTTSSRKSRPLNPASTEASSSRDARSIVADLGADQPKQRVSASMNPTESPSGPSNESTRQVHASDASRGSSAGASSCPQLRDLPLAGRLHRAAVLALSSPTSLTLPVIFPSLLDAYQHEQPEEQQEPQHRDRSSRPANDMYSILSSSGAGHQAVRAESSGAHEDLVTVQPLSIGDSACTQTSSDLSTPPPRSEPISEAGGGDTTLTSQKLRSKKKKKKKNGNGNNRKSKLVEAASTSVNHEQCQAQQGDGSGEAAPVSERPRSLSTLGSTADDPEAVTQAHIRSLFSSSCPTSDDLQLRTSGGSGVSTNVQCSRAAYAESSQTSEPVLLTLPPIPCSKSSNFAPGATVKASSPSTDADQPRRAMTTLPLKPVTATSDTSHRRAGRQSPPTVSSLPQVPSRCPQSSPMSPAGPKGQNHQLLRCLQEDKVALSSSDPASKTAAVQTSRDDGVPNRHVPGAPEGKGEQRTLSKAQRERERHRVIKQQAQEELRRTTVAAAVAAAERGEKLPLLTPAKKTPPRLKHSPARQPVTSNHPGSLRNVKMSQAVDCETRPPSKSETEASYHTAPYDSPCTSPIADENHVDAKFDSTLLHCPVATSSDTWNANMLAPEAGRTSVKQQFERLMEGDGSERTVATLTSASDVSATNLTPGTSTLASLADLPDGQTVSRQGSQLLNRPSESCLPAVVTTSTANEPVDRNQCPSLRGLRSSFRQDTPASILERSIHPSNTAEDPLGTPTSQRQQASEGLRTLRDTWAWSVRSSSIRSELFPSHLLNLGSPEDLSLFRRQIANLPSYEDVHRRRSQAREQRLAQLQCLDLEGFIPTRRYVYNLDGDLIATRRTWQTHSFLAPGWRLGSVRQLLSRVSLYRQSDAAGAQRQSSYGISQSHSSRGQITRARIPSNGTISDSFYRRLARTVPSDASTSKVDGHPGACATSTADRTSEATSNDPRDASGCTRDVSFSSANQANDESTASLEFSMPLHSSSFAGLVPVDRTTVLGDIDEGVFDAGAQKEARDWRTEEPTDGQWLRELESVSDAEKHAIRSFLNWSAGDWMRPAEWVPPTTAATSRASSPLILLSSNKYLDWSAATASPPCWMSPPTRPAMHTETESVGRALPHNSPRELSFMDVDFIKSLTAGQLQRPPAGVGSLTLDNERGSSPIQRHSGISAPRHPLTLFDDVVRLPDIPRSPSEEKRIKLANSVRFYIARQMMKHAPDWDQQSVSTEVTIEAQSDLGFGRQNFDPRVQPPLSMCAHVPLHWSRITGREPQEWRPSPIDDRTWPDQQTSAAVPLESWPDTTTGGLSNRQTSHRETDASNRIRTETTQAEVLPTQCARRPLAGTGLSVCPGETLHFSSHREQRMSEHEQTQGYLLQRQVWQPEVHFSAAAASGEAVFSQNDAELSFYPATTSHGMSSTTQGPWHEASYVAQIQPNGLVRAVEKEEERANHAPGRSRLRRQNWPSRYAGHAGCRDHSETELGAATFTAAHQYRNRRPGDTGDHPSDLFAPSTSSAETSTASRASWSRPLLSGSQQRTSQTRYRTLPSPLRQQSVHSQKPSNRGSSSRHFDARDASTSARTSGSSSSGGGGGGRGCPRLQLPSQSSLDNLRDSMAPHRQQAALTKQPQHLIVRDATSSSSIRPLHGPAPISPPRQGSMESTQRFAPLEGSPSSAASPTSFRNGGEYTAWPSVGTSGRSYVSHNRQSSGGNSVPQTQQAVRPRRGGGNAGGQSERESSRMDRQRSTVVIAANRGGSGRGSQPRGLHRG